MFSYAETKKQNSHSVSFDKTKDKTLNPFNQKFSNLQSGNTLQRKCACNGSHNGSGECEECKKKKLSLHRKEANSLQTNLTINTPGDAYEKEADAMADKIMRMSSTENINPKNHEEGGIQRKESSNNESLSTAPPIVNEVINSTGEPLNEETRSFMEPGFGFDFKNVRIHNDSLAHQSSADINALAYTYGNHVVFGTAQYKPDTAGGKKILAHELTHVVQQQNNVIQRISIVDCDNKAQESKIEHADAKAVTILSKVIRILRSKLTPANKLIIDDLSNRYFKIKALNKGQTEFLINQYENILDALISDAYRYECEDGSSFFDGCSDNTYAYVYPGWTNIHMCMNILKNKGTNAIAETIIHELSHVVGGTGDWRYCGIECTNDNIELGPVELPFNEVSMNNADSFSNFALNLYLNGT